MLISDLRHRLGLTYKSGSLPVSVEVLAPSFREALGSLKLMKNALIFIISHQSEQLVKIFWQALAPIAPPLHTFGVTPYGRDNW